MEKIIQLLTDLDIVINSESLVEVTRLYFKIRVFETIGTFLSVICSFVVVGMTIYFCITRGALFFKKHIDK